MPKPYTSPYEILNEGNTSRFLLICDHASNAIPDDYAQLGLPSHELERHVAWDMGAAEVTRHLADILGCPAILSGFSRLLIDPNRGLDDPTLIMKLSDGIIIPGNLDVDQHNNKSAWQDRVSKFYMPYHLAIASALDKSLSDGQVPIILSVHSFTPNFKGEDRPWSSAVLWDKDDRLAKHLFTALSKSEKLVGNNQPYSGRLKNDCLYRHGTENGLPHALIELRQDCLMRDVDCQYWVPFLANALTTAETDPICAERKFLGSYTENNFKNCIENQ